MRKGTITICDRDPLDVLVTFRCQRLGNTGKFAKELHLL